MVREVELADTGFEEIESGRFSKSGLEENECKWFGTWSSLSGSEETESGWFGHGQPVSGLLDGLAMEQVNQVCDKLSLNQVWHIKKLNQVWDELSLNQVWYMEKLNQVCDELSLDGLLHGEAESGLG